MDRDAGVHASAVALGAQLIEHVQPDRTTRGERQTLAIGGVDLEVKRDPQPGKAARQPSPLVGRQPRAHQTLHLKRNGRPLRRRSRVSEKVDDLSGRSSDDS
jgi:hypothetical protein